MAIIATGFFDGVHLGHRKVIETLVSSAASRAEEAIVITFAKHPRAVLQQDARQLRLLSSPEEKDALLKSLGVDRVEMLEFSKTFAQMSAREYLQKIIIQCFGGTMLVLGYDNRLGSDRLVPEQIIPLAQELGLEVQVVQPYFLGQVAVSSTKVREALCAGDVQLASQMLSREYSIKGVVVGGKQLGRKLGFPTANMQLYDPLKIYPKRGAYLSQVLFEDRSFYGMTNVGDIIETHIFDFSEDIYGLDIEVKFLERLRDEIRFESIDALKDQLSLDKKNCQSLIC